ncbi:MAG: methylated-DNA--[protein]-cysteine S-methyltransferase [Candidatus Aminicenantes bacterium]|nr:methylated-DNA--[protein]-cysteine S-methyltransferase [Candidatus Aminicenantes bacterium]
MRIEKPFYELIPTAFGTMGIVWWNAAAGPRVRQVFLSRGRKPAEKAVLEEYPAAQQLASSGVVGLGDRIQRFLEGETVVFDLEMIALEVCGEFQRQVLLAEHGIPRGWVSTYGRIARHVGSPGSSRAVGRALATNPFPIIIPCHRAVRADGEIGGYQGGGEMKRALLVMEGVEFTGRGTVLMRRIYY